MLVSRYGHLGGSPSEIMSYLFRHPTFLFTGSSGDVRVFIKDHLKYLAFTVGPFLPFMVRAWNPLYLVGLAVIGMNWLSPSAAQRSMVFHYDLFALSFFAFALARSLRVLSARGSLRPRFVVVTLLVFLAASGTWPLSKLEDALRARHRIPDAFFIRAQLAGIPAEEPLLADAITYPQIVDRVALRLFPEGGRAGKSSADGKFAILRKEVFETQPPAWKETWSSETCSASGFVCLYQKR
jgi:hypothetical protein